MERKLKQVVMQRTCASDDITRIEKILKYGETYLGPNDDCRRTNKLKDTKDWYSKEFSMQRHRNGKKDWIRRMELMKQGDYLNIFNTFPKQNKDFFEKVEPRSALTSTAVLSHLLPKIFSLAQSHWIGGWGGPPVVVGGFGWGGGYYRPPPPPFFGPPPPPFFGPPPPPPFPFYG
ncbi:hypothetical protein RR46_12545 [Papilio xuthus]|uniref:Uncharacterized protein n=1 Tax=Papilio xuthus TaxID=66420 RepID=A0A194PZD5_PAPXU|nr:hypothetical protein RR46_12545 [Papilio xuthus]